MMIAFFAFVICPLILGIILTWFFHDFDLDPTKPTITFQEFIQWYNLNPSSWTWREKETSYYSYLDARNVVAKESYKESPLWEGCYCSHRVCLRFNHADAILFKRFKKQYEEDKNRLENNERLKELVDLVQKDIDNYCKKNGLKK